MTLENHEFTHGIVKYIGRLERQRRRYVDEHLRERGLYGSMFMIVLILDKEPGSSQDNLCHVLGIDKSNVARRCRQMEELGFIRREQSKKDRRQNRLFLTDQGQVLLPEIRSLLTKWSQIIMKDIDEHNRKNLLSSLSQMMNNALNQ